MNFKIPPIESKLDITGERFVTQWRGQIELEHYHRYLFTAEYCKGKCVLDIASGEGYGSFLLSQAARKVCGVDVDGQAVELANEKYGNDIVSFHVGSCEEIPFAAYHFDIVVSFETLEHVGKDQQVRFLKEIKRVLKPGGLLIMSSPEKEVYDVFSPNNPFHVHEITHDEFESLIGGFFQHHKILSQSLLIGSMIQDDSNAAMDFYEADDCQQILRKERLERLEYLICIASDTSLPPSHSGMYLDTYFDSDRGVHLPRPDGYAGNLERIRCDLQQGNELLHQENLTLQQDNELIHQENKTLQQDADALRQEKDALSQESSVLRDENSTILASRSWRYTRPFRVLMAFLRMDKRYLYDSGQQIRNRVWVLRQGTKAKFPRASAFLVEPCFRTVKKVFKPILRTVLYRVLSRPEGTVHQDWTGHSPYESNYQDNLDFSGFSTDVKALAFFLPQFHQIPENDRWWGEGFTEWTNTKRAKPLFSGHYQPREPHDDIGYYDLSDVAILKKQAVLARQHGIYGFCFYHYYFHGKRLLEKPVEILLEHPEIDIHFCLCWANESWTKKWDGAEDDILIAQEHSAEDDINFIKDLCRYLKDPRYIKSNGKPIIMVYRPLLLPEPKATFARWRNYCRQSGVGEIAIWAVRGCFNQERGLGLEDVTEAEVEFPPHLTVPQEWISPARVRDSQLKSPLVDYKALVKNVLSHKAVADKLSCPVYRTVMLGWDNTARRNELGYVFYGFSTRLYYKWLRHIVEDVRKKFCPEERFVFINAWNEWAEGTYLEPDKLYGYANINTTSKALFDLPYRFKHVLKTSKKKENDTLELAELAAEANETTPSGSVAVHAHIFHTDLIHEMVHYINNIPVDFDCYITTDTESKKQEIANKTRSRLKARNIEIRVTPNIGRDVAPFIVGCRDVMNAYDFVCHIHTKKSEHGDFGDHWRDHLLDYLLGGRRLVNGILSHFKMNPKTGLIYPPVFSPVEELAVWGDNYEHVKKLLKRADAEIELPETPIFPVGTMIWMRTKAFKSLLNTGLTYEDFEPETGQLDGTLAHAFERSLVYIVNHNGYCSRSIARE